MSEQNILAVIAPIIDHIKTLNHPKIKVVKDVPEFEALENRKVQTLDGAVYVFPNGSSTDAQRASGIDIRCTVGVGIAICVRTNTIQGMPYYERAGEVLTDIMTHMARFAPNNQRYPKQRFILPQDGAQERDHSHLYANDHFFLITRYIYQTFLKGENK